jgi:hypothetical protein
MRRSLTWLLLFSLAPAIALACSASEENANDDDDGNSSSGNGGAGGMLFTTGGGGPGGGNSDGCSDEAKLVYVLSDADELYSFQPDAKLFTRIGQIACPTNMQPNSMAVDRNAVAWVNYVDSTGLTDTAGSLFRVSTTDASCEQAPAVTLPAGWYRMGMGFSTDGANTSDETLFVTGISGGGDLGWVDVNGGTVTPVGSFTGGFTGQNAELTGTGDGRLFGFFTSVPVEVGELDKSNANVINNVPLPAVEVPSAWAFSFWGGDFYLYTASIGTTTVNRYRPSDSTVDTAYMSDIGFRIVGAGVSTCAPLAPPQ